MAPNSGVSNSLFLATRSLEVGASHRHNMLMTIWIKDFLFPSSLGSKSCKLIVSINLAFAQYFVILKGRFSLSPSQINLFVSAMVCCYLLWSGDKIYYF